MPTRSEFEAMLASALEDYPEVSELYQAGDPRLRVQVGAIADFLVLMSQELEISELEPFLKTRDRSILADASNKGILPTATAARHNVSITNDGATSVTLSAGRVISDNQGRPWRLLSGSTIAAGATTTVVAEQSEISTVSYTVAVTEAFHQTILPLTDGLYLADLAVQREDLPTPVTMDRAPRWMNVLPGDEAYRVLVDSLRRITVEFGDTDRAGRTATAADEYTFTLLQTYGKVDHLKLREASLDTIATPEEQKLRLLFLTGGIIRAGADPLTMTQLRLMASYPALYDESAVYLGNFDFLVRRQFAARCGFISVWNESAHERAYGSVDFVDMNRLHVAVSALNPLEQTTLEGEVAALIGRADSLYSGGVYDSGTNPAGKVIVDSVVEREYALTVTARLAGVHDIDTTRAQIKAALLGRYGKGQVAVSRWLPDGINLQEASTIMRMTIPAFQDRISDFSLSGEDVSILDKVMPHQWLYLSDDSITVDIKRTADQGGALWTL